MTQAIISDWTIGINITLSQMFSPAPYNFTPAQIGYLGTGAIIGGCIAEAICLSFNDKAVRRLAAANHGVFERMYFYIYMSGFECISNTSHS